MFYLISTFTIVNFFFFWCKWSAMEEGNNHSTEAWLNTGYDSAVHPHLEDKGHSFEDQNVLFNSYFAQRRKMVWKGIKEVVYIKANLKLDMWRSPTTPIFCLHHQQWESRCRQLKSILCFIFSSTWFLYFPPQRQRHKLLKERTSKEEQQLRRGMGCCTLEKACGTCVHHDIQLCTADISTIQNWTAIWN